jgi:effector-binding domain-containing protein
MPMPTPTIVHRAEEPYLAIPATVTMETINAAADRLPELFDWLAERGIEPTGAPFFRYDVIDMRRQLQMQVGFPVPAGTEGDGEIVTGVLPAGRYVTVTHVGHPDQLLWVTKDLLDWADSQELGWDMSPTDQGDVWGCRLEVYRTDPRVEPDLSKWETDLLFRLAD